MATLIDKTFIEATDLISNFETQKLQDTLDYFGLKKNRKIAFSIACELHYTT